ncbi:23S rRNA (pseudouridine(1915)-N(3))-methyltransferase RlmH [Peptoniphilus catoniae]|uniref:23S rRNA (pseudouridine(1915)-N(3))-methyltransferase RlmH n=1 Tax=Peptoniphilus catoniae TaxID=1660341 RepID=UPI0010FE598B|nr:23S rRNA (pseudouridine(1915)-N(3))-methyltransferase RlmH [Peptoniphilus catoniae]
MNINIIGVGKVKEDYIKEGVKEFTKRLSSHAKVEIIEVPDEAAGENLSEKDKQIVIEAEGERLKRHIKSGYTIALDIKGKKLSSEAFAEKLKDIMLEGNSTINFLIGGSLGLSEEILKEADFRLSFSDMTFPHQLMRLILLEQVYRCFRIINNYPYHK